MSSGFNIFNTNIPFYFKAFQYTKTNTKKQVLKSILKSIEIRNHSFCTNAISFEKLTSLTPVSFLDNFVYVPRE